MRSEQPALSAEGFVAQGIVEDWPVAQFELGGLKNFIYLILDWSSRAAAIIDPQEDIRTPLDALAGHGFTLESCFLTHSHHDHIAGLPALQSELPELPVFVHAGDRHRVEKKKGVRVGGLVGLQDGQRLRVGELAVDVIHTPGHSSGECCFLLAGTPPVLFTGDTLFIRDCGRTDLETGSNEEMFASLQKIKRLPSDAIILPGHHYKPEYASVLSRELRESPPLLCRSVQELIELP